MNSDSDGLALVARLLDLGAAAYSRLSEGCLAPLKVVHERSDERIVLAPTGDPFLARYHAVARCSEAGHRTAWFTLESQVAHMSSIVACIAMSPGRSRILVTNLNMKRHLGCVAAVVGVRGAPMPREGFLPSGPPSVPAPLIVKANPRNFRGVRLVFKASESAIVWCVEHLERATIGWFNAAAELQPGTEDANGTELEGYIGEMKNLHCDGGVFDEIFGQNWVPQLFGATVFGESFPATQGEVSVD